MGAGHGPNHVNPCWHATPVAHCPTPDGEMRCSVGASTHRVALRLNDADLGIGDRLQQHRRALRKQRARQSEVSHATDDRVSIHTAGSGPQPTSDPSANSISVTACGV